MALTFPQPHVQSVGKLEIKSPFKSKSTREGDRLTGKLSTVDPTYPQKTVGYPQRSVRLAWFCPHTPQIWGGGAARRPEIEVRGVDKLWKPLMKSISIDVRSIGGIILGQLTTVKTKIRRSRRREPDELRPARDVWRA